MQYVEDIGKANKGGLAICVSIERKVVRGYKNLKNPERCSVELYKKYLSRVPKETSDNAPLRKTNGQIWYHKKDASRESLGNVLKIIMKKGRFEGHYTNHSLRRGCATRLYDAGIADQVIQETTGHRSSDGVKAYKCTSS